MRLLVFAIFVTALDYVQELPYMTNPYDDPVVEFAIGFFLGLIMFFLGYLDYCEVKAKYHDAL